MTERKLNTIVTVTADNHFKETPCAFRRATGSERLDPLLVQRHLLQLAPGVRVDLFDRNWLEFGLNFDCRDITAISTDIASLKQVIPAIS